MLVILQCVVYQLLIVEWGILLAILLWKAHCMVKEVLLLWLRKL